MTASGAVAAVALGIAALAAMAATDWSKAETVTVVTTEYGFQPNRLTFRAGTPYRLHLENRGKETHEFTAPGFLQSAEIRDPAAVNADRNEILVQPGEQKDVFLVPRRGRYPLSCADHDWVGMTGEIVVE
jgi:uncharacterized cupredoxin-like copper-binding protein